MQRSLGFARITAEEVQLQLQRIAAEAERAASEAAAAAAARRHEEERAALLRPGPGRPKLERSANDALAVAAAAAAATGATAATADAEEPVQKRGKYCNWFATPEAEDEEFSDDEENEDKHELDVMKERQYGSRKGDRKRAAPKNFWVPNQ